MQTCVSESGTSALVRMYVWTAPGWQVKTSRRIAGRCSHVFGLLARYYCPLASYASADQVPISPHSTMHWHMWVVLIAGSTGSALPAVRPPNLHITPDAPARSRSRRKGDGFLVPLAPNHPIPSHSGELIGECDGGDLGRDAAPAVQKAKVDALCHGSWHSGSRRAWHRQ